MLPIRALAPAVLLATVLLMTASPAAHAQLRTRFANISPTASSFDATDPDGASGGRVNGLAVASDGQTFYAASEWGGLHKSTDGGQTWSYLAGHLPVATWDVAVDPEADARVYATSFYDGRVNSLAGINVSTDGGATWTHPASAGPPAAFGCLGTARRTEPSAFGIAVDPAAPDNVYVGTNCGLALSADKGVTWDYVDPTPTDPADTIWDVVVHDGGIIDVCGDDGHLRSTDGGTTWSTATSNPLPAGRCSLAVSPDESYVLLASSGNRIFESDDGGTSWPNQLSNPLPQGRIPFAAVNDRSGRAFDLWFGDVQLHRAGCTTPTTPSPGGTRRCPANTWSGPFTRAAGAHDDAGDLAFDPRVSVDACPVLFSSDGGVYRNTLTSSPTCQSPAWEQPTRTPRALWLFGMDGAPGPGASREDLYFGNQDNGTFATRAAGVTTVPWTNRDCCDGFDVSASSSRVLYTVCCFRTGKRTRLYVRNQGMQGGGEINTYPPGNPIGFRFPDVLDQFSANGYVLITTGGVFVTNNVGASPVAWTQLGAATSPARACAVKTSDAGGTPIFYVQAGTCSGNNRDQLWRYNGTAAGGAWQRVTTPDGTGGFGIFDVDPNDPDRLFVSHLRNGVDPQMALSDSAGPRWRLLPLLDSLMIGYGAFRYTTSQGPTFFTGFNGYVQPSLVALDPDNSSVLNPGRNILVAGGQDSGVFLSTDEGTTWARITADSLGTGLPLVPRPRFTYFDHEQGGADVADIFIGTQGRGVWRATLYQPGTGGLFALCALNPSVCHDVELDLERITIPCLGSGECIGIDPLERNCLVKFDCPGCGPTTLCPPWHWISFEDFDRDLWEIELTTRQGDLVEYELVPTDKGVVLSFRPDEGRFEQNGLGDYVLYFRRTQPGDQARYEIRTTLEVADEPFPPGGQ